MWTWAGAGPPACPRGSSISWGPKQPTCGVIVQCRSDSPQRPGPLARSGAGRCERRQPFRRPRVARDCIGEPARRRRPTPPASGRESHRRPRGLRRAPSPFRSAQTGLHACNPRPSAGPHHRLGRPRGSPGREAAQLEPVPALHGYPSLVREAYDEALPLALIFIDDALSRGEHGGETYLGLAGSEALPGRRPTDRSAPGASVDRWGVPGRGPGAGTLRGVGRRAPPVHRGEAARAGDAVGSAPEEREIRGRRETDGRRPCSRRRRAP